MAKTKTASRWPVHVSLPTYTALRALAKDRDMSVAALADEIVSAGVKRKRSDEKRPNRKSGSKATRHVHVDAAGRATASGEEEVSNG